MEKKIEEKMNDFIRIANARLRSRYPFKPQRRAVVAKMWREYFERLK